MTIVQIGALSSSPALAATVLLVCLSVNKPARYDAQRFVILLAALVAFRSVRPLASHGVLIAAGTVEVEDEHTDLLSHGNHLSVFITLVALGHGTSRYPRMVVTVTAELTQSTPFRHFRSWIMESVNLYVCDPKILMFIRVQGQSQGLIQER